MFGNKSIKSRVWATVKAKIKTAQDNFKMTCDEIDKEAFTKKEDAAELLVQSIIGGEIIK